MSDNAFATAPLGRVCRLVTDGSHFSPVPQDEGFPIVNAKDIPNGRVNLDTCTRISEREFTLLKSQNCAPIPGDVLLSKDGTIGRVVNYSEDLGVVVLSSIAILRPDAQVSPDFLAHSLRSHLFDQQLYRLQSGSALKRLVLGDIRKIEVPVPHANAQRRIAEILKTVDEAMEQTEALVGKLEQMKAGLMHDLFTRGVTPDGHLRPTRQEAPHLYHQTPIGWVPKEWEVVPFRSVLSANLQNGYFKKPELVGRGYKLVNVSELYQPLGIDTDQADVERVEAIPSDYQRYGVSEGDLFFTRSSLVLTGIAHCNVMLKLHEPTLFECHVIRAKPDPKEADPAYLGLYFQTGSARRELMARAKHTTMTTISQPDILAVPILKPPLDEQKRISNSVAANMSAIYAEKSMLAKLRQQKQGLMQDLLTGRVPV